MLRKSVRKSSTLLKSLYKSAPTELENPRKSYTNSIQIKKYRHRSQITLGLRFHKYRLQKKIVFVKFISSWQNHKFD